MQDRYPAKTIAQALDLSERATRMRADRESWLCETETCRGGKRRLYLTASLPEDVRTALIAHEGAHLPAESCETPLTEAQRRKALAKADLVRLYTDALAKASNKGRAREEFIAAYTAGVWPAIREVLGDVSWKSVERWKLAMRRTGSVLKLADTRGGVRVEPVVTERHAQILLALARHPNKPRLAEVCRMAREAFKAAGLSDCADITLYRYLKKWMATAKAGAGIIPLAQRVTVTGEGADPAR